MSTNQKHKDGSLIRLAVASGITSGAPCVCGQLPGVAEVDRDANGYATVNTRGCYAISVKAIDANGNVAVDAGDKVYFTSGDTPPVSKKATGVYFGIAYDTDPPTVGAAPAHLIASGSTATIRIRIGA